MESYLNMLEYVKENGVEKDDRTGTGTYSVFGEMQFEHKMYDGFPLLTTKKMMWDSILAEFCWFVRGETNVEFLHEHDVHIWDEWADEDGELGPVYGKQLRDWETPDGENVDQLMNVVDNIKNNPYSRRHVFSLWNPADVPDMNLPPCHVLTQFNVRPGATSSHEKQLDLQMYQRSADIFLGVPFNIASYALLLKCVAYETECLPGNLTLTFGDLHLYKNHVEQAEEQLSREPGKLPHVSLDGLVHDRGKFPDIEPADFTLHDYHHATRIKAPISV